MDTNNWHALSADETLKQLDTRTEGLTSAEAAARLSQFGRNEIERGKRVSPLRLLLKQFANFLSWS